jgi:hypothetical protein
MNLHSALGAYKRFSSPSYCRDPDQESTKLPTGWEPVISGGNAERV